jgi:hypothetical protein
MLPRAITIKKRRGFIFVNLIIDRQKKRPATNVTGLH